MEFLSLFGTTFSFETLNHNCSTDWFFCFSETCFHYMLNLVGILTNWCHLRKLEKKTWWQHLWIYCPSRWWIIILIFKIKFSSKSGNIGTIWCQNKSIQLLWLIMAFYVHENMSSRSTGRFPFLIIVLCCKQHGFHSIQQLN